MKDSVLFVNRDKAEIESFRSAMQDYTFDIDTAESGVEAAVLLRKKKYKVLITGMTLSTYDGTKLIAYLNAHCPYTACIVYTTRLDLAQLHLLVNKRDVFRIFLKPINYRGDFYNAIKDGFAYYDMQEAAEKERKLREQKQKSMEEADIEMRGNMSQGEIEWKNVKQFIYPLVEWETDTFATRLSEKQKETLADYERDILEYYLREGYQPCHGIQEMTDRIYQEFVKNKQKQKITIKTNKKPVNPKIGFYEELYFIIWLLIRQIADISLEYEIKINLDFQIPFRPEIQMQGNVDKGKLEEYRRDELKQSCMEVNSRVLENFVRRCERKMTESAVMYRIEMSTEEVRRANYNK